MIPPPEEVKLKHPKKITMTMKPSPVPFKMKHFENVFYYCVALYWKTERATFTFTPSLQVPSQHQNNGKTTGIFFLISILQVL